MTRQAQRKRPPLRKNVVIVDDVAGRRKRNEKSVAEDAKRSGKLDEKPMDTILPHPIPRLPRRRLRLRRHRQTSAASVSLGSIRRSRKERDRTVKAKRVLSLERPLRLTQTHTVQTTRTTRPTNTVNALRSTQSLSTEQDRRRTTLSRCLLSLSRNGQWPKRSVQLQMWPPFSRI